MFYAFPILIPPARLSALPHAYLGVLNARSNVAPHGVMRYSHPHVEHHGMASFNA